jgi:hypothetical protein
VTVECFDDIRIGRAVVEHEVDELTQAVGKARYFTAPPAGGRAWNTGLMDYWVGWWSSEVGLGFSPGCFRSFIRFFLHSDSFVGLEVDRISPYLWEKCQNWREAVGRNCWGLGSWGNLTVSKSVNIV